MDEIAPDRGGLIEVPRTDCEWWAASFLYTFCEQGYELSIIGVTHLPSIQMLNLLHLTEPDAAQSDGVSM